MQVWRNLKLNPLHLILGLVMFLAGSYLIIDDNYFLWPPDWTSYFNNDLVDVIVMVIGVGYFAFVLSGGTNQLANAILLASTAFVLTFLLVMSIGHGITFVRTQSFFVAIFEFGFLLLVQYCATHSKTVKRRK